jgi:Putative methyltransferase
MPTDRAEWHRKYDNPDSTLPRRLEVVRGYLADWLVQAPTPARALSLCAGEARDLLPVLAARPGADVSAVLVELDAGLAQTAEDAVRAAGLERRVQVRRGDAGDPQVYAGVGPCDLVLLAGIFGNISDADIERTIRALPMLCAPGAWVIWTRHRQTPDLTGTIREWFAAGGFEEVGFTGPDGFGVGAQCYPGVTQPWDPRDSLFTFFR